ncbi:MAG: lytic murein transglycosylase [Mesorhizobium sp.]|nr:MAG: lytic murein transglycosylase [Mesorhizobium sp.]TJW35586.1 MAG: lytic murein transglycosylase [Mesorhizobium sp.]
MALYGAPLWPAGHLPLQGGDQMLVLPSLAINAAKWRAASKLPISPLEGEMPSFGKEGRTEGGALAPTSQSGGTKWAH